MIGKNMMLCTSAFRNVKSFSLVPVTKDCPYVESMFDPTSGILAVITNIKKESFHMVSRLDSNGQPVRLKVPNKETGKTVKEQRVAVDTFSEFYITEKEEIENFINLFAINSDTFDWKTLLEEDPNNIKQSNLILPTA
jgi:hypothetical protein